MFIDNAVLDRLIQKHGVAVEFFRSVICPCWNEERGEADYNCTICFGWSRQWVEPPVTTTSDLVDSGTVVAATATTITLRAGFVYKNDLLVGKTVKIVEGNGLGEQRRIVSFNNLTKIATVNEPWLAIPNSASKYEVRPTLKAIITTRESKRDYKEAGIFETGTAFGTFPSEILIGDFDKVVVVDDKVVINNEVLKRGSQFPDGTTRERLRFKRVITVEDVRTLKRAFTYGLDFVVNAGVIGWVGNAPQDNEVYTVRYVAIPEYLIFANQPRFRKDGSGTAPMVAQLKRLDKASPANAEQS